jgi:hypothetical protein
LTDAESLYDVFFASQKVTFDIVFNMTSAMVSLLLIFLTYATLISAFPNATSTPIAPGTCQGYPGYVPQPIGELTQQFFFEARDTSNSSLTGLRISLSSSSSNSSELIINTDPTAAYNIFSCSNGTVFDIHGGPTIVFSTDQQDQELGYPNTDAGRGLVLNPEVYTHEIGGVVEDGLFLGWGNVTTWGFLLKKRGASGSEVYRMRLLNSKTSLKDGEIDGFVRIVAL